MASLTRILKRRRALKRRKQGRQRKNQLARRSTLSYDELFAECGKPQTPASPN